MPFTCVFQPRGGDVGRNTLLAVGVDGANQTTTLVRPVTVRRFTRPGSRSRSGRAATAGRRTRSAPPGGCRGRRTVAPSQGCSGDGHDHRQGRSRTVATRRAEAVAQLRVRPDARFRSRPASRLRLTARFGGNDVLASKTIALDAQRVDDPHRPPGLGSRAMDIEGANALVAGGASGLGAATARRLHEAGANVTIADLNPERGSALADELGADFVAADVTDAEQVEAAVPAAGDDGLRISVCCAGIGWAEKVAGGRGPHAFEPFETVIRVNLIGTFNVLRLAAAAMLANEPDDQGERGVCISTASIAAYDGQIGQIAYSASKGGIVGMTLPAARDLAQSGIRVCAIAPGLFDTPLLAGLPEEARNALGGQVPFPPRLGRPDEYAALAVHIVENTMLNGEVIRLDGALRMPPR